MVKILSVDAIQDGILRFEFAAAEAALDAIAKMESILKESSKILRVEPKVLPKTVERFFEEWKEQRKEIERLKEELARVKGESLLRNAEDFNSIKVVVEILSADMSELIKIGDYLAKKGAVGCLMTKSEGKVFVVTFAGKDYDAREIMREVGNYAKGSGGGKRELAQGAVAMLPSREEVLRIVFEYLARKA